MHTNVLAPEPEVKAAVGQWRTREGTKLLILYGSLIAVSFPALFFATRLLPGHIPDSLSLRVACAAFSLVLAVLVLAVRPARAHAYRLQAAHVTVFLAALAVLMVLSRGNQWYLVCLLVGVFGVQYAFLRWQDLAITYGIALCVAAAYAARFGVLMNVANLYALGAMLFGSLVSIATGTLRLRGQYAQVYNGLRLERQAGELRRQTEQIAHLAYSDGLTGLLNRTGLNDRIDRTLAIARRHKLRAALLYLDLDGFKDINDNLGHDAGDAALIEAALRVQYLLRNGETFARIGGDEFVVLMPVITVREEPLRLAERIEEAFADPFYNHSGASSITLGASIGYAIYPDDGTTRLELLAQADRRMYEVKRRRSEARHSPT